VIDRGVRGAHTTSPMSAARPREYFHQEQQFLIGSRRPRELETAIAQAMRERVPPIGGAEPH
jgi:hypothetical protein